MNKALITCGNQPGVYFLEKWLPDFDFIYGDASFIAVIPVNQQLLLPSTHHPSYIHELLTICIDQQINALFPMASREQELLAEAAELFTEFDIQLFLPDIKTHRQLKNDLEVLQTAAQFGLQTIPHRFTESFAEFSKACLDLGFPDQQIAINKPNQPGNFWLLNERFNVDNFDIPQIDFSSAAKIFGKQNLLLLRQYITGEQSLFYAVCFKGKITFCSNPAAIEAGFLQMTQALSLSGIWQIRLHQGKLFSLKLYSI